MTYYFLMLLVPVLASLARSKPGPKLDIWLGLYLVLLLAFIGLRHQVGPDWHAYKWNFEAATQEPWSHVFEHREPGYFLFNKISETLGWGVYGVNLICSAIFLSGIYAFARRTWNPWLAVAMVVPYLVFIVGMSGIRQAAAIGLGFHLLASWQARGNVFKVLLILAAMSIHSSAILLFVFLVLRNDRYLLLRLFFSGIIVVLAASTIAESQAFARYNKTYIETNVESVGALAQVALSAFPALLYWIFRKKIRARSGLNPQVELGVLLALGALLLVPLSTTGVSRAALYLSFVQMWVYPAFVHASSNRMFGTFAAASLSVIVFAVYFFFGTHAFAYLNYQNIMGSWFG